MVVSWDTEWSHSRCPAATTCLTRSGWACACVPTMQNVALTPYWRSTSSTWGVHTGSGPSSMVMLTPRAPWSEACAMSAATGLTALPRAADVVALGDGPPNAPACAVHTEAPAASNVTPSAAPSTLLFQPRPPCRAMSVPPSRSSSPIPWSPCDHLAGRATAATGCVRYRSRTIPGSSRTTRPTAAVCRPVGVTAIVVGRVGLLVAAESLGGLQAPAQVSCALQAKPVPPRTGTPGHSEEMRNSNSGRSHGTAGGFANAVPVRTAPTRW